MDPITAARLAREATNSSPCPHCGKPLGVAPWKRCRVKVHVECITDWLPARMNAMDLAMEDEAGDLEDFYSNDTFPA